MVWPIIAVGAKSYVDKAGKSMKTCRLSEIWSVSWRKIANTDNVGRVKHFSNTLRRALAHLPKLTFGK